MPVDFLKYQKSRIMTIFYYYYLNYKQTNNNKNTEKDRNIYYNCNINVLCSEKLYLIL